MVEEVVLEDVVELEVVVVEEVDEVVVVVPA